METKRAVGTTTRREPSRPEAQSERYLALLKGDITPDEYVRGVRDEVDELHRDSATRRRGKS
jgi:hypothetical protein